MKNILIIAAATAALLAPLSAAGQSHGGGWGHSDARAYARYEAADRRDDGRGGGGRYGGGQSRYGGGGPGRYDGAPRYGGPEGAGQSRYGGAPGRYSGPGQVSPRTYDGYPRGGPRAAAPAYPGEAPRGARSWRQGQYLPPAYRGAVVRDPGRYRLRPPPPGYDWVGVGPDIYLMQRGTGMVLDTIPGGY